MKTIYTLLLLFLGTTVFAQENFEVDFNYFLGHKNKILLKFYEIPTNKESVSVMYVYESGEIQNLEIPTEEYKQIIEALKEINLVDLLQETKPKRYDSMLNLRIENLGHEITIDIYDFKFSSLDEKYKPVRNATRKILNSVGLSLKDLK